MLKWLKGIFKKRKNNCCEVEIKENTCKSCVYWKSEEENNVITVPPRTGSTNEKRYCDIYNSFTKPNHTCALYIEEKFEAQPDSIQTKEYDLDLDLSIEESELNDQGSQQK